ncbi:MAG: hypothetical protein WA118_13250, partial [Carboxydocellales bacterium]
PREGTCPWAVLIVEYRVALSTGGQYKHPGQQDVGRLAAESRTMNLRGLGVYIRLPVLRATRYRN